MLQERQVRQRHVLSAIAVPSCISRWDVQLDVALRNTSEMRGGRKRASIASDVVGSNRACHGLPIVVHDDLARFLCRFRGSAAASRRHVICVVPCVVSDVNQAWREVSGASDLLSCVLRVFGVCSGPFLLFDVGVAVSQGVAYDSPSSQHSTQSQLC